MEKTEDENYNDIAPVADTIFKQFSGNLLPSIKKPSKSPQAVKYRGKIEYPDGCIAFFCTQMRGIIAGTQKTYDVPYVLMFKTSNRANRTEKIFIPLKYLRKTHDIIGEMLKLQLEAKNITDE